LWRELWPLVQGRVLVIWHKAHADDSPIFIDQYGLSARHVIGNTCADVMAGRGADLHQVSRAEADNHHGLVSLASRIQLRLVAVLHFLLAEFPRAPRPARKRAIHVLGRHALAFASPHIIVPPTTHRGAYTCASCGPCPFRHVEAQIIWFLKPCLHAPAYDPLLRSLFVSQATHSPRPVPSSMPIVIGNLRLHASHVLWLFRHVFFCRACGARAITSAKLLRSPCTGRAPPARAQVLSRLMAGELPWGFLSWPSSVGLPEVELELLPA